MSICPVVLVLWVAAAFTLAFFEMPAGIRKYWWRVTFWLLLTLPFVLYRISVAVWAKTCW